MSSQFLWSEVDLLPTKIIALGGLQSMKEPRRPFALRFASWFFAWRALYLYSIILGISYASIQFGMGGIEDPFDRSWLRSLMFFLGALIPLMTIFVMVVQFIENERGFRRGLEKKD